MEKAESTRVEPITSSLVDCVNIAYDVQIQELKKSQFSYLSISEVHVLEAISLEKEPTMTNVARRLCITIGSLTTAINKLLEKKMVERKRDNKDRRVVKLFLTDQGIEVLDLHNHIHEKIDLEILKCIPEDKQEWVLDKIDEISTALKKMVK